ncbi:MAG: DUF6206 family protein [Actinomycetota bacterium]
MGVSVSDEQLLDIEHTIRRCIAERTFDGLDIKGFGEIGVAIGVPTGAATAVVKRLPSSTDRRSLEDWFAYVARYEAAIAPHVTLAPTEQRILDTGDGRWAAYLVQPCYPAEQLTENILAAEEPEAGHPLVVAVRDAALSAVTDGRQAIDPQFSNFVWHDDELTLIDTGSPFLYHADGSPDYDMGAYAESLPAVLRPLTQKLAEKVVADVGTPSGNLALSALSIVRLDQERWLDDVLTTFNERLDDPIDRAAVMGRFDELHGEMQRIKKITRVQRFWVERIRRGQYEFFITDSFTGELI